MLFRSCAICSIHTDCEPCTASQTPSRSIIGSKPPMVTTNPVAVALEAASVTESAIVTRGRQSVSSLKGCSVLEGCCYCFVCVVHVPAPSCALVNVNGAGDCLVAGTVFALQLGMPLTEAVSCGVAAAKLACESSQNVPESLSQGRVIRDGEAVAKSACSEVFHVLL